MRYLLAGLMIGTLALFSGAVNATSGAEASRYTKKPRSCAQAIRFFRNQDLYPVCMPGENIARAYASRD